MIPASSAVGRFWRRLAIVASVPVASACHTGVEGEVRDWRPADHQAAATPGAAQTSGKTKAGEEDATLIAVSWQQNCHSCHGPTGRGDGPQGRMLRVADLSRVDWQARTSDEAIEQVIRKGRNKMPAFDLPPRVISGLVKRIRSFRRER